MTARQLRFFSPGQRHDTQSWTPSHSHSSAYSTSPLQQAHAARPHSFAVGPSQPYAGLYQHTQYYAVPHDSCPHPQAQLDPYTRSEVPFDPYHGASHHLYTPIYHPHHSYPHAHPHPPAYAYPPSVFQVQTPVTPPSPIPAFVPRPRYTMDEPEHCLSPPPWSHGPSSAAYEPLAPAGGTEELSDDDDEGEIDGFLNFGPAADDDEDVSSLIERAIRPDPADAGRSFSPLLSSPVLEPTGALTFPSSNARGQSPSSPDPVPTDAVLPPLGPADSPKSSRPRSLRLRVPKRTAPLVLVAASVKKARVSKEMAAVKTGGLKGKKVEKVPKRKGKAPTSCAECRRLKMKCNLQEQQPCSSCVARGCPTVCPDGELANCKGKRLVLAGTEALHARIAALEAALAASFAREDPALSTSASGGADAGEGKARVHPLLRAEFVDGFYGQESEDEGEAVAQNE